MKIVLFYEYVFRSYVNIVTEKEAYVFCNNVCLTVFYKWSEIILFDIRRYCVSVGYGPYKT
jgi:hypothetical protein